MLMLRKLTQPMLDAVGLNDLHTEIMDRCLTIVGSCGKPLVTIRGITFGSSKISNDEREYAAELFSVFLGKHKEKLLEFVTLAKATSEIPKPTPPDGFKSAGGDCCTIPLNGVKYSCTLFVYKENFNIQGSIGDDSLDELRRLDFTQVRAYLESIAQYNLRLKAVNDARQQIQTCSI